MTDPTDGLVDAQPTDQTATCGSCGTVFDLTVTDDCPTCQLGDLVDALVDDVSDVQDQNDELLARIPRGDA